MKITTEQGFMIIKIINKMEVKGEILKTIQDVAKLQNRKKALYKELFVKVPEGEQITNELSAKLLSENKEISEGLENANSEMTSLGLELAFLILENVPKAEAEFYKTMSKVLGIKETEVKDLELNETISKLFEIAKSESFQKLFTLVQK